MCFVIGAVYPAEAIFGLLMDVGDVFAFAAENSSEGRT